MHVPRKALEQPVQMILIENTVLVQPVILSPARTGSLKVRSLSSCFLHFSRRRKAIVVPAGQLPEA